jgi:aldehyde dehydrogenase (NAD+)
LLINNGEACAAWTRILVPRSRHDEAVDAFRAVVEKVVVGDPFDPRTDIGPLINEGARDSVEGYIRLAEQEGARVAIGGGRPAGLDRGWYVEPTILVGADNSMRSTREEIFGPVVSVIPCKSLEEAIAIGNGVEYGLSASIYTQDINRAFHAMRDLYTGIFYVNAPTIGAEVHLPFGGTKHTGNGHREAGVAALEVFSEWKSIYIDFSGKLQRAQIDA